MAFVRVNHQNDHDADTICRGCGLTPIRREIHAFRRQTAIKSSGIISKPKKSQELCNDPDQTPTTHTATPPGAPEDSYAERVTGIEPALSAWEAEVLPLNYTRVGAVRRRVRKRVRNSSVKYAPSYE